MHQSDLETALRDSALGGLRYFPTTGSTNDEALAWAASGARDFSLVLADGQTRGRGRDGRQWFTPVGSALAFSLVLRPNAQEREFFGRFAGLGALALVEALQRRAVPAQIKWPNDVLVGRKKLAGILVEAVWTGAQVDSLVLGMGVNVAAGSLPPAEHLNFPATCVDLEAGQVVARVELLRDVLVALRGLRPRLGSAAFLAEWQERLAFRGELVSLWQVNAAPVQVELLGLEGDGSLRVRAGDGEVRVVHFGEVHLRPG